ncbi:hypothetical protein SBOR_0575 [Sclerotinia borealis F-4128]|uniref:DNA repair metallo-beta-lactamase domain-containing protein n=1 Tax=Sclerotinia borealis (strain F-4128) TaxID=1432307 RepID=W9CT46_SCLBF|nr:hypothetical protein SBOR_0575 [Sclerotinia borealis F-4128]
MEPYKTQQDLMAKKAKEMGIPISEITTQFQQKLSQVYEEYSDCAEVWALGKAEYLVWNQFFPNDPWPGASPIHFSLSSETLGSESGEIIESPDEDPSSLPLRRKPVFSLKIEEVLSKAAGNSTILEVYRKVLDNMKDRYPRESVEWQQWMSGSKVWLSNFRQNGTFPCNEPPRSYAFLSSDEQLYNGLPRRYGEDNTRTGQFGGSRRAEDDATRCRSRSPPTGPGVGLHHRIASVETTRQGRTLKLGESSRQGGTMRLGELIKYGETIDRYRSEHRVRSVERAGGNSKPTPSPAKVTSSSIAERRSSLAIPLQNKSAINSSPQVSTYGTKEKEMEKKAFKMGGEDFRHEFFRALQNSRDMVRICHPDHDRSFRHWLADRMTWEKVFKNVPFPWLDNKPPGISLSNDRPPGIPLLNDRPPGKRTGNVSMAPPPSSEVARKFDTKTTVPAGSTSLVLLRQDNYSQAHSMSRNNLNQSTTKNVLQKTYSKGHSRASSQSKNSFNRPAISGGATHLGFSIDRPKNFPTALPNKGVMKTVGEKDSEKNRADPGEGIREVTIRKNNIFRAILGDWGSSLKSIQRALGVIVIELTVLDNDDISEHLKFTIEPYQRGDNAAVEKAYKFLDIWKRLIYSDQLIRLDQFWAQYTNHDQRTIVNCQPMIHVNGKKILCPGQFGYLCEFFSHEIQTYQSAMAKFTDTEYALACSTLFEARPYNIYLSSYPLPTILEVDTKTRNNTLDANDVFLEEWVRSSIKNPISLSDMINEYGRRRLQKHKGLDLDLDELLKEGAAKASQKRKSNAKEEGETDGRMEKKPCFRLFRQILGRTAPLVCFLSHVHSDHLNGLDNDRVKLPFIYCSAATKEILVRLEKRRDRLNLAKGILEKEKRTYKHLKNVLKPIPLETPTLIELAPRNEVRVTLFDANHCTGAVMFLFERENTAILYTGDIRSEPWFVNSLTRNPFLIEYTSGMKTLDCIYLDTSNTGPITFPTKAEGLKELIGKVRKYPPKTKFHFSAWTFGYEDVWLALSRTLDSQIHVDKYKINLYRSLRHEGSDAREHFLAPEGPVLAGCVVGNGPREGCLTTDKSVRIHSCEKEMGCSVYDEEDVVLIRPIITRLPSRIEVAEVGIGGGWGDLVIHELALGPDDIKELLETVFAETDEPIVEDIRRMLLAELKTTTDAISLDSIPSGGDQISLIDVGESLLRKLAQKSSEASDERRDCTSGNHGLPRLITFPYSRHSYPELRHLVETFQPKDVYPCTVDEEEWHEGLSIKALFGDSCSASTFRHDDEMRHLVATRAAEVAMLSQQTQTTIVSRSSPIPSSSLEDTILRSARWSEERGPSTPTPAQNTIAGASRNPVFVWSEEIVYSPPAPSSQKSLAGTSQTPDTAATNTGSSSGSQNSRRRIATEMISPPAVKRVRLSDDFQMDDTASPKSFTPSTDAAGSKQQSLEPVKEPGKGDNDLILPLTTMMEQLGNITALCDQAIIALMALNIGDIGIETYLARQSPVLDSIRERIDLLVSPPMLYWLHTTLRRFSQDALNILLDFINIQDMESAAEVDVYLYFNQQLPPLQSLAREFKQATSYAQKSDISQHRPWNPARSLHSMSELFQPGANYDTDTVNNQDCLTLVNDNERAANDGSGDPSDNYQSSLVAVGENNYGNHIEFDNQPFHDPIDNILRCADCGHEIWEDNQNKFDFMPGFCTGCGKGAHLFYKESDFAGAFPHIYDDDEVSSEVSPEDARVLIGENHLDYQSSAYDTQDENSELVLNEDYEVNSFVEKDESLGDSDSDDDTDNDINGSEINYEVAFEDLQREYAELRAEYFGLVDEYSQFKYDMLGTTEEEDDDDGDDQGENEEGIRIDGEGAHVVDVVSAQGDHAVTDVVVSSFRGGGETENEKEIEKEKENDGDLRLGEDVGEKKDEGKENDVAMDREESEIEIERGGSDEDTLSNQMTKGLMVDSDDERPTVTNRKARGESMEL